MWASGIHQPKECTNHKHCGIVDRKEDNTLDNWQFVGWLDFPCMFLIFMTGQPTPPLKRTPFRNKGLKGLIKGNSRWGGVQLWSHSNETTRPETTEKWGDWKTILSFFKGGTSYKKNGPGFRRTGEATKTRQHLQLGQRYSNSPHIRLQKTNDIGTNPKKRNSPLEIHRRQKGRYVDENETCFNPL